MHSYRLFSTFIWGLFDLISKRIKFLFQKNYMTLPRILLLNKRSLHTGVSLAILYIITGATQECCWLPMDRSSVFLSENISHRKKQLDIPDSFKLTEQHVNPMPQKNQAYFLQMLTSLLLVVWLMGMCLSRTLELYSLPNVAWSHRCL